jgi:exodeoxyribonuclease VII large subunit
LELTLTVTELSKYLQKKISKDDYLQSLQLIGEVSNHHYSPSGHHYFSLKDDQSIIKCVLFNRGQGGEYLLDGNQILSSGKISIYQARGELQFYADKVETYGVGTLQQEYEKLKLKLESEGLFDLSRKRQIPNIPRKIGLVTSKTGSVLQDIINIISRRYPNLKIILADTRVQGVNAAGSIEKSIKSLNKLNDIDFIIIARGGGSLEDLWPFNEELVARAIYASNVPVISAIGHETDITISDLVADLRAPTPSAAAEISTPDVKDLRSQIHQKLQSILGNIEIIVYRYKNQYLMSIDKLFNYSPKTEIWKIKLSLLQDDLINKIRVNIDDRKLKVNHLENNLRHLDYHETLSRGFFISTLKKDNTIIKDITKINAGDHLIFSNLQGMIEAETIKIKKNKGNNE